MKTINDKLIIGEKYSKTDLSEFLENEDIAKVREGIYNKLLNQYV